MGASPWPARAAGDEGPWGSHGATSVWLVLAVPFLGAGRAARTRREG